MKKYALNPYLPELEYIPDGEPHVFGDRVYVYGSHDRFDGARFCMNDYISYSASVTDLANWRYEGVIYKRSEDPRLRFAPHEMWAPDVVHGKDGRYYLYYCPDSSIRSIGVAVCDEPAGEYHFLGLVHDKDGGVIGERPGDTIAFDPGVFVDDDGCIYLYSGNGPITEQFIGAEPKGSRVMRLEDDMLTIAEEPRPLLPMLGEEQGTGFEGHAFFEASSIRKINGKYYLVYSSNSLHELCYAISDKPDRDFRFGGVVISNCDIMQDSEDKTPQNAFGNDHGGIERINGQYYVFYHRQTNRHMYSRQGCAEKIKIEADGSIKQVQMTSCGLNDGPLPGKGLYPANCVAHLRGSLTPTISAERSMKRDHPFLIQDVLDTVPAFDAEGYPLPAERQPGRQFITNCQDGLKAMYRWFDFADDGEIAVKARGTAKGTLSVYACGALAAEIALEPARDWTEYKAAFAPQKGVGELEFRFAGEGIFELLEFEMR